MNSLCLWQLAVRAYDLSVPRAESPQFATVRINVIRNDNCPVFTNLPNTVTISQTTAQFNNVYDVSATDNDPAVSALVAVIIVIIIFFRHHYYHRRHHRRRRRRRYRHRRRHHYQHQQHQHHHHNL